MTAQRDVFIQNLYEKALTDKDIIFISADMGAPSLDQWKDNLPDQFIAAGISEQNAINIASGLSNLGKKVFVYMMASWFARCFEQVRYSCAMANNPITILGNGVALGYAPSGPAHEPNEDIALARTLNNIEVISPSNNDCALKLVNLCLEKPNLRYIRFERSFSKDMENVVYELEESFHEVNRSSIKSDKSIAIISSGFMLGRANSLFQNLKDNYDVKLFDLWKIKPLNSNTLKRELSCCSHVITIEEQSLEGGFSSSICEFICDNSINVKIKRFGLPNFYIFENGTRDYLLNKFGLSNENIMSEVVKFLDDV